MNRKFNIVVLGFALLVIAAFSSCGGSSESNIPLSDPNKSVANAKSDWHDFFNSRHYSGHLAVMLKAETKARLRDGQLVQVEVQEIQEDDEPILSPIIRKPPVTRSGSLRGKATRADLYNENISESVDLEAVNEIIAKENGDISRGMNLPERTIEKALAKARKEGKRLHDWNLFYVIKAEEPEKAEALYLSLIDSDAVLWAHPIPNTYLPDTGIPTPDISNEQTYLGTEAATGGLNVYAAWNAGITGQGVRIVDQEQNWNFDHEDLPIDTDDLICENCDQGYLTGIDDPAVIQHGTATVGVLAALNNGIGITGIAHSAEIKVARDTFSWYQECPIALLSGILTNYAEGSDEIFVRAGDIVLVEIGNPGPATPPESDCTVDYITEEPNNCLPIEAYKSSFDAIHDINEFGVIVVEAAGNGGTDLSSPDNIPSDTMCDGESCPNLATEDSGAIMVAASEGGHDHSRPWWSNCGTRINAFAWGSPIVTTGYGDHPASDPTEPNKWYNSGYYDGTSAATAQVAGAVALVQSYAKELYKNKIIIPEYLQDHLSTNVYLDSSQMKELINLGGVSGNSTCNIGKKPDVGAMMQLLDNEIVEPHIDLRDSVVPNAVAGIRYDVDKDGRADLISWNVGVWKIDLSSVTPNIANPHPDNYGEWDIQIEIPTLSSVTQPILFPVVHDYDSDGDADLALYDSKNGLWYIKYTTDEILNSLPNEEFEWDRIIDYSSDPAWAAYSIAVPGDYDGDNYLDLALATPNGRWLIDYGGMGHLEKQGMDIIYVDKFGTFEENDQFLTDEQLVEAPGWAYLPGVARLYDNDIRIYKVPDGLPDEGKLGSSGLFELSPVFGTNEDTVIFDWGLATLKRSDGYWDMAEEYTDDFLQIEPLVDYGGILCRPVLADYSGDGIPDRMVKCGSTWKMSITLNGSEFREIQMDDSSLSLPPYVYPGGVKYQDIVSIYNYYKYQLGCPTGQECTIFDAVPPISPYFAQCLKYWAPPPPYCWNK